MAGDSGKEVDEKTPNEPDGRVQYWRQEVLTALDSPSRESAAQRLAEIIANLESRRFTDPKTGLLSALGIWKFLGQEIAVSRKFDNPVAVFVIDADNFKQVNDKMGHDKGDELIRNIAKYLKENIRKSDAVGRLGGDEFVIICPGTNNDGALEIGEKIRSGLSEITTDFAKDQDFKVTISGGMTVTRDDNKKVSLLINEADAALLEAKGQGKNRLVVYKSDIDKSKAA